MQSTATGKQFLLKKGFCPTPKLLRVMKLTVVLLIISCLQVSARGYAQKLSLVQKDADLSDVFKKIEKQTGYTFLYNDRTLRKAKKVTFDSERT